jgi:hypothetical protein
MIEIVKKQEKGKTVLKLRKKLTKMASNIKKPAYLQC